MNEEPKIDLEKRFEEISYTPRFSSNREAVYSMATTSKNFDEKLYDELIQTGNDIPYLSINANLALENIESQLGIEYDYLKSGNDKFLYFLNANTPEILTKEEKEYVGEIKSQAFADKRYEDSNILKQTLNHIVGSGTQLFFDTIVGGLHDLGTIIPAAIIELNSLVTDENTNYGKFAKDLRDSTRKHLAEESTAVMLRESVNDFNMKMTRFNENKVLGIMNQTVQGAGKLGVFMAAGGPLTYSATIAGNTYVDTVQRNPDIDSGSLLAYTALVTGIEYASNKIFSDVVFGAGGFNLVKYADPLLTKSGLGYGVARVALEAFGEGVEEGFSEIASGIAYKLIIDKSADWFNGEEIVNAAIVGGLIGGLMSGATIKGTRKIDGLTKTQTFRYNEKIQEFAKKLQSFKKSNNVTKLMMSKLKENPNMSEKDIMNKYNDEYNEALQQDQETLIKLNLYDMTFTKIVNLMGETKVKRALDVLQDVQNFYDDKTISKVSNKLTGKEVKFKRIVKPALSMETPDIQYTMANETQTQQRVIDALENITGKPVYLYKPVKNEGSQPENAPKGFITDGSFIAFNVDIFDQMGMKGAIDKVVQHELAHLLQLNDNNKLSSEAIRKLHRDIKNVMGNFKYTNKDIYKDERKLISAAEKQADYIAENTLFDDITIESLLLTNKSQFTKTYNWIKTMIGKFRKNKTENGKLKFRQLLDAKNKYDNMLKEQVENQHDVDLLKNKLNLTDDEVKNLKSKYKMRGRFLNMNINFSADTRVKHAVEKFLRSGMGRNEANLLDYHAVLNERNYTPEFREIVTQQFPNDTFTNGLNKLLSLKYGVMISTRYGVMIKTIDFDNSLNDKFESKLNIIEEIYSKTDDMITRNKNVKKVTDNINLEYGTADKILNIDNQHLSKIKLNFIPIVGGSTIQGSFNPSTNAIDVALPILGKSKGDAKQLINDTIDNLHHELVHAVAHLSRLGGGGNSADVYINMTKSVREADWDYLIDNMIDKNFIDKHSRQQLKMAVAYRVYTLLDGEQDSMADNPFGSITSESGFKYKSGSKNYTGYGIFDGINFKDYATLDEVQGLKVDEAAYDALKSTEDIKNATFPLGLQILTKKSSTSVEKTKALGNYIKNESNIQKEEDGLRMGLSQELTLLLLNPNELNMTNIKNILKDNDVGTPNVEGLKVLDSITSILYSDNENVTSYSEASNIYNNFAEIYAIGKIGFSDGKKPVELTKKIDMGEYWKIEAEYMSNKRYMRLHNSYFYNIDKDIYIGAIYRLLEGDVEFNIEKLYKFILDTQSRIINVNKKNKENKSKNTSLDKEFKDGGTLYDIQDANKASMPGLEETIFNNNIYHFIDVCETTLNNKNYNSSKKVLQVVSPLLNAKKVDKKDFRKGIDDITQDAYDVVAVVDGSRNTYRLRHDQYVDALSMFHSKYQIEELLLEMSVDIDILGVEEKRLFKQTINNAVNNPIRKLLTNEQARKIYKSIDNSGTTVDIKQASIYINKRYKDGNLNPDALEVVDFYKNNSRFLDDSTKETILKIVENDLSKKTNQRVFNVLDAKIKKTYTKNIKGRIDTKIEHNGENRYSDIKRQNVVDFYNKHKEDITDYKLLLKINDIADKNRVSKRVDEGKTFKEILEVAENQFGFGQEKELRKPEEDETTKSTPWKTVKEGKKDTKKEDTKKEDTKKEDTKKEDTKKEDTKKEDTKKEDTKKEDTKKEDTKKEGPKRSLKEQYINEIKKAKKNNPDLYWSVDLIEDFNKHTILKGKGGFILIASNGDIKGLFKIDGSTEKNVGRKLLQAAVKKGGDRLDNFDIPYLTETYTENGFKITGRMKFNKKYAPADWNESKHGTPDVVAMVYDPYGKLESMEEVSFTSYDEMINHRDGVANRLSENTDKVNIMKDNVNIDESKLHPITRGIFTTKFDKKGQTKSKRVTEEYRNNHEQNILTSSEWLKDHTESLKKIDDSNIDNILDDIDMLLSTITVRDIRSYHLKSYIQYIYDLAAIDESRFTTKQRKRIQELHQSLGSDAARAMALRRHGTSFLTEIDPILELELQFKKQFGEELKLDKKLKEDFNTEFRKGAPDYNVLLDSYEKVIDTISQQMPKQRQNFLASNISYEERSRRFSRFMKKSEALRYMAMLSNFSTHAKNLTSNTILKHLERGTKTIIGIINDKYDKNYHKSQLKEVVKGTPSKEVTDFVTKTFVENGWIRWSTRNSGNKYKFAGKDTLYKAEIKRMFESNTLNWINETIDKLLIGVDKKFMNKEIEENLANLLEANFKDEIVNLEKLNDDYQKELSTFEDIDEKQKNAIEKKYKRLKQKQAPFLYDGRLTLASERAIEIAMRTYLKSPTALVKIMTNLANQGPAYRFMATAMFPFARVGGNILLQTWEYSPGNLIKGLYQYFSIKSAKKVGVNKTIDNLKSETGNVFTAMDIKTLQKLENDPFYEAKSVRNLAKGTIGTSGYALGIVLALSGILKLDEDEEYNGIVLKIGEFKMRLKDLAPGTSPLLMGASIIYTSEKYPNRFKNMVNVFTEQSVLSSFDSLFKYNHSWLDIPQTAIETYFSQFVPAIGRSVAKVIDPAEKDTSDNRYIRSILKAIPLVSYAVPNKIDPYTGKTKYKSGDAISQAALNLLNIISPISMSVFLKSDIEKEAINVGAETNYPSFRYTINGEEYEVTNKKAFAQKRAEVIYNELNNLINSSEYKKLSQEEKASRFNSTYYQANLTAKINDWTKNKKKYIFTNRDSYKKYMSYLNKTPNIMVREGHKGSRFID